VDSSFFSSVWKATSTGRSAVSFGAVAAAGAAATAWFTPEQPARAKAKIVVANNEMILILCMAIVLFMFLSQPPQTAVDETPQLHRTGGGIGSIR